MKEKITAGHYQLVSVRFRLEEMNDRQLFSVKLQMIKVMKEMRIRGYKRLTAITYHQ